MALLDFDNFGTYSDAQNSLGTPWQGRTNIGGFATGPFVTAGIGHSGGAGLRLPWSNSLNFGNDASLFFSRQQSPGDNKCGIGVWVKIGAIPTNQPMGLFAIYDNTAGTGATGINNSWQLFVAVDNAGKVVVYTGFWASSCGTLLATSTSTISTGQYYWVELFSTIHSSTGSFELRIDNATEATYSGNTSHTGNNSWNFVQLGHINSAGGPAAGTFNLDWSDPIIYDGTDATSTQGRPNNTFFGPSRVDHYYPTADGNYTQLTPSTGSSHFALVDENPPTDDTDYNSGASVNLRDSLIYSPTDTRPTYAMRLWPWTKKTDASAWTYRDFVRVSSTDYDAAADVTIGASYGFTRAAIRGVNPATSALWNVSSVEFGVKITTANAGEARFSSIPLLVLSDVAAFSTFIAAPPTLDGDGTVTLGGTGEFTASPPSLVGLPPPSLRAAPPSLSGDGPGPLSDILVSTHAVEAIGIVFSDVRVSQQAIETVTLVFPKTRVTQHVLEVIAWGEAAPGGIFLSCPPLPFGRVGVFYSDFFVVTGGTAPFTFELIDGEFPPDLVLDPDTGELSGYPTTPGTYTFTVRVTDSNGFTALTAEVTCNIGIFPLALVNPNTWCLHRFDTKVDSEETA